MKERSLLGTVVSMLSPLQRRRYVYIQTFFIGAAFLQVAGAGSVAPFVALLSNPEILQTNEYAYRVYVALGFTSDLQAIVAVAIAMLVLLAFSNATAAFAVWLTYKFSLRVGLDLQRDLLSCYLRRPYIELAGVNSSDLINKVSVGAPRFAFNVMLPLLNIASQGAVVLVILTGLLVYQPKVLLVFGALLGGGYGILFFVVRRRLVQHGEIIWNGGQQKYRLLTESLGGLKEIRIAGTEETYRARYLDITEDGYAREAVVGMLGEAPRFILETIAFGAILVLSISLLAAGKTPTEVVALVSLYAMTGYRVLPAGQSIFKAVSQIRSNLPVLEQLLPDVVQGRAAAERLTEPSTHLAVPPYPADIQMLDVSFSYPSSKQPVLDNVSTTIRANTLTALVGHSGSGKSTLSDIILGLLPVSSGSIQVGDRHVSDLGRNWFSAVGYVPQSIFLIDDSIAANVAFGSPNGADLERVRRALELASLHEFAQAGPDGMEYRVGERGARLSGGQRQRVGIARALYNNARYLILDEATSALDGRTEAEVLDTLLRLRQDRTIIMIAHRLSSIQAADHVIHLDEGRVVAEGDFNTLTESNETFRTLVNSARRADNETASSAS